MLSFEQSEKMEVKSDTTEHWRKFKCAHSTLPQGDYVSPNFVALNVDPCFPNKKLGKTQHLRSHNEIIILSFRYPHPYSYDRYRVRENTYTNYYNFFWFIFMAKHLQITLQEIWTISPTPLFASILNIIGILIPPFLNADFWRAMKPIFCSMQLFNSQANLHWK